MHVSESFVDINLSALDQAEGVLEWYLYELICSGGGVFDKSNIVRILLPHFVVFAKLFIV